MKSHNEVAKEVLSIIENMTPDNFEEKFTKLKGLQKVSCAALTTNAKMFIIDYQEVFKLIKHKRSKLPPSNECNDKELKERNVFINLFCYFLEDLQDLTTSNKPYLSHGEARVGLKEVLVSREMCYNDTWRKVVTEKLFSNESLDLIFKQPITKTNSRESRFKEIKQLLSFMDTLKEKDSTSYRIARVGLFNEERFTAIFKRGAIMRSSKVIEILVKKLLTLDIDKELQSELLNIALVSHLKYDDCELTQDDGTILFSLKGEKTGLPLESDRLENLVKEVFSSKNLDAIFKDPIEKYESSESRFEEIKQLLGLTNQLKKIGAKESYWIACDKLFNLKRFVAICGPDSKMRSPEVIRALVENLLALDIPERIKSDLLNIVLISKWNYKDKYYDLIPVLGELPGSPRGQDILFHKVKSPFKLGDYYRGIVFDTIFSALLPKDPYPSDSPHASRSSFPVVEGDLFELYLLGLTKADFDSGLLSNQALYKTIKQEFFTLSSKMSFGGPSVGIGPLCIYSLELNVGNGTERQMQECKESLAFMEINSLLSGHFKFMDDLETCLKTPKAFQAFFVEQMKLFPKNKDRINFILDYVHMKVSRLPTLAKENEKLYLSTLNFCYHSLREIDHGLFTYRESNPIFPEWLSKRTSDKALLRDLKLRIFPKEDVKEGLAVTLTRLYSFIKGLKGGIGLKELFRNEDEYRTEFYKCQYIQLENRVKNFNDRGFYDELKKGKEDLKGFGQLTGNVSVLASGESAKVLEQAYHGELTLEGIIGPIAERTKQLQKDLDIAKEKNQKITTENAGLKVFKQDSAASFVQVMSELEKRDKTIKTLRETNGKKQEQIEHRRAVDLTQQKLLKDLQATNGEQKTEFEELQIKYESIQKAKDRMGKALGEANDMLKLKEKEHQTLNGKHDLLKQKYEKLLEGCRELRAEKRKIQSERDGFMMMFKTKVETGEASLHSQKGKSKARGFFRLGK